MTPENPPKKGNEEGKVGYKHPPKEHQFKKGQNANPFGRKKGTKNFDTIFEEAIKRIVKEKKINIQDPEMEMVVKAVIEALKGNYNFFSDIMDRRYGKPRQPIDMEGNLKIENLMKIQKITADILNGK